MGTALKSVVQVSQTLHQCKVQAVSQGLENSSRVNTGTQCLLAVQKENGSDVKGVSLLYLHMNPFKFFHFPLNVEVPAVPRGSWRNHN